MPPRYCSKPGYIVKRLPARSPARASTIGAAQIAEMTPPSRSIRRTSSSTASECSRFVAPGIPPGRKTPSQGSPPHFSSKASAFTVKPWAPAGSKESRPATVTSIFSRRSTSATAIASVSSKPPARIIRTFIIPPPGKICISRQYGLFCEFIFLRCILYNHNATLAICSTGI